MKCVDGCKITQPFLTTSGQSHKLWEGGEKYGRAYQREPRLSCDRDRPEIATSFCCGGGADEDEGGGLNSHASFALIRLSPSLRHARMRMPLALRSVCAPSVFYDAIWREYEMMAQKSCEARTFTPYFQTLLMSSLD